MRGPWRSRSGGSGWSGRVRLGLVALVLALATTACEFDGAYDLPLPGSPVDADDAYQVTADFGDVLNVVPRSPVRVDDVTVGEVTEVDRRGWHARITMNIREDVELPDNAVAEIRQSSLLGAKYVWLGTPEGGSARGDLGDGDHLPLSGTGRNPEVEEVLGALSFLLSGGGVGQLSTITTELNNVMSGRTGRLRHLLRALEQTVATVDEQKTEIIQAMESVNSLSRTLNREKQVIGRALEEVPEAVEVLSSQHDQLMTMLGALDDLGRVGTRVIRASREDTLAILDDLRPVLRKLNEAGQSLAPGMRLLMTFPFPKEAEEIVVGDYANTSIRMDMSLKNMMPDGAPGGSPEQPAPGGGGGPLPDLPAPGGGGGSGDGSGAPDLGGLLGLRTSTPAQSGTTDQDPSRRELLLGEDS